MKKQLPSVWFGLMTFAVGSVVGIIFGYRHYNIPNDPVPEVPVQIQPENKGFDCRESASFPGLSKPVKDLHLYKKGFFPEGAFNEGWESSDNAANDWYGRFLKAMGEKPLIKSSSADT